MLPPTNNSSNSEPCKHLMVNTINFCDTTVFQSKDTMANDRLIIAYPQKCQKEGFFSSTLQRMVSKIGDIIHQQKISRSPSPPAIELALDPTQHWTISDSESNPESPTTVWDQFEEDADDTAAKCGHLVKMIEATLREAKTGALRCGEVLIPSDLTVRIARDVIRMSENEPCGLRGCVVLFDYEDQQAERRRIGRLQYDPSTVATFELILTLKKDMNTWLGISRIFPFRGCLRKLGKGPTIIVSPGYSLVKRKLYRSSQHS